MTRNILNPVRQAIALVIVILMFALEACAAPTPTTPVPTPVPTPVATPAPSPSVTIDLTAQNISFDKSTIAVPAGASVAVNFNNKDSGFPHNFALYTNSSATTVLFRGQILTGPNATTYRFTAPATQGNYFFRCDVHPRAMTGSFVVTAGG